MFNNLVKGALNPIKFLFKSNDYYINHIINSSLLLIIIILHINK